MFLKRLEIQGFKSFPEKIYLSFEKGITSVVGPNGSGKSNISDAVRWVLGEQSAKNLRGGKMEDIIFAGTQSRKPLGFAEVSLVMDNSDKKFELDFSEIIITRRVYRSGESEFSINKSSCRLKDIHELFMDTGIGREGYSIIGQGRIDDILNDKSSNRRFLFEEAAGIIKFRTRRDESLLKLEREKQNLIRIDDILYDLESKISPLKNQSDTAKKYLLLIEELKNIKINIFMIATEKSDEMINNLKNKLKIIEENIITEENKKSFIIKKIEELKILDNKTNDEINILKNDQVEIRSKIEQFENDIKLLNEKNNYINTNIARLDEEIKNINFENEKKIKEKEIFKENLTLLIKEKNEKANKLFESQSDFDSLSEKIKEKESITEKFNTEIIEGYKKESELNTQLNKLTNIYESFENRKEEINIKLNELVILIKTVSNDIKIVQDNICIEEEKFYNLGREVEFIDKKLREYKEKLELIEFENNSLNLLISENVSRYKIIKELEEDFEGYINSVKAILIEKKKNEKFCGVRGAIGELIEVTQKYEIAIEIALGSYVQNIVVDDEETGKIAIEFLKKTKQGRCTFLPLTTIKGKQLNSKNEILNNIGVLGVASDIVKFEEVYKGVILNLLGRTVICDNINNAILLNRKYNNSLKIVTLEGEIFNSGGAMTGGSIIKKQTNIFGRSRQILELEDFINKNKQILESKKNEEILLKEEVHNLIVDLESKKAILKEQENVILKYKNSFDNLNINLLDYEEKYQDLIIEDGQLMEQIFQTNKDIRNLNLDIYNTNENIKKSKNDLINYNNSVSNDEKTKDLKIKALTDLKISINSLDEKINLIVTNLNRFDEDLKTSFLLVEKITEKLEIEKRCINNNLEEIKIIIFNMDKLINEQKEKNNFFENLKRKNNNILKEKEEYEKIEREQLELITNIEKEQTRLLLRLEQVEDDRRKTFDLIWEEYELTYNQALKLPKLEESQNNLIKREAIIKNQIKELGVINIAAIEDYRETKEKFDFLNEQKNDIKLAENKLKEIITELTNLMTKRFIDQFKTISENFNFVFKEMFNGGKAYLKLSDEDNILESGVEIIAQPPGKNLQNMNLLSGGERALTAIALLFGILKMKPSPFCILDEIEAALDEANVQRFASYIKKLSNEIQFIIVTHRKGTMEVSDILYGVTMQEMGISKLVSVELKDF